MGEVEFKLSFQKNCRDQTQGEDSGDCQLNGVDPQGPWESPRLPHTRLQAAARWFKDPLSPVCPALGYTVSSFSNGFPGCPGEGPRFSAPRRPSTSSLRHPSLGEESTHALIAPDEQVSKWLPRVFLLVGLGVGKYNTSSR